MKICLNGIWKNVVVDDWLPTRYSNPIFSKANGKFVWVPILEKAFAKAHGTYLAIENGLLSEAMRILTGAPSFHITIKEKSADDLWKIIKRCDEKKYVLSCSAHVSKAESERYKKDYGILSGHAYTLIEAIEVVLDDGSHEKLLKVRNPWGSYEWTGDWSDDSSKWTN